MTSRVVGRGGVGDNLYGDAASTCAYVAPYPFRDGAIADDGTDQRIRVAVGHAWDLVEAVVRRPVGIRGRYEHAKRRVRWQPWAQPLRVGDIVVDEERGLRWSMAEDAEREVLELLVLCAFDLERSAQLHEVCDGVDAEVHECDVPARPLVVSARALHDQAGLAHARHAVQHDHRRICLR